MKAREEFNQLQHTYRQVLARANFLVTTSWREVSFNPQDPRGAREQVERQAQMVLGHALRRLDSLAKDGRQTLMTVLGNLDNLSDRDRQRIDADVHEVLAHIEHHMTMLPQREQEVQDPNVIQDVRGVFVTLVESLANLSAVLTEQSQHVYALRSTLGEIAPTADEGRMLVTLREAHENSVDLDIVELMAQFTGDAEDFWNALRGLYEKDRVRIHLQLKDV